MSPPRGVWCPSFAMARTGNRCGKSVTVASRKTVIVRASRAIAHKADDDSQIQMSNSQFASTAVIASVSEAIHGRARKEDGLLRRFAPRNDGQIHVRVPAARSARVLRQLPPSLGREGAGKAGCRLHPWVPCKKSTGVGPQVQPETSGFPCAMVYGL